MVCFVFFFYGSGATRVFPPFPTRRSSDVERPRTLHFELDFLEPEVTYEAAIYADAPDADWRTDPTACDVSVRYVTSADAIDVVLAPGGGQAISFLPL